MTMRNACAALVLAGGLIGGQALAQGADEDVKCMIASNIFVKAETDQAKRQVAVLSSYFYLGRVDGRLSGAQLSAALKSQAGAITPQTAGPIMTACAKRLQSTAAAMQTMGKELAPKK